MEKVLEMMGADKGLRCQSSRLSTGSRSSARRRLDEDDTPLIVEETAEMEEEEEEADTGEPDQGASFRGSSSSLIRSRSLQTKCWDSPERHQRPAGPDPDGEGHA